jgi:serine/threonine protein kinase
MNDLESGVHIGSYELLDVIGRTNMSEVWRAQDRGGNLVALKTISQQAGNDAQLRARFLREGASHQELKHPAIVPILDFFEADTKFYLVMQYIADGSLADRLENLNWEPLPIAQALNIASQVLPALDFAHQKAVIHRDVKPSNILLEGDKAYLTDFGIALALGRPRLTNVAQVIGTRLYMSPEQIQTPLAITHLTDVYSFGCVLYEMLTGQQPHGDGNQPGDMQYAALARRVHEPPIPLRQWNPEISVRLERIVLTALAPNPQDRFPGCGSFARALEMVRQEQGGKAVLLPLPPLPIDRPAMNQPPVNKIPPAVPPPSVRPVPVAKICSAPLKPVSIAGNVFMAIVAGFFWTLFLSLDESSVEIAITASLLASHVLLLRMLYKSWQCIPRDIARTTPGKAAGLLLIPLYNFYWSWQVFPGFAEDYNRHIRRSFPLIKPQLEGFYVTFCVVFAYFPFLMAILQLKAVASLLLLLNFMVLIPIMIGILAGAINRLVTAVGQPAIDVIHAGQGRL